MAAEIVAAGGGGGGGAFSLLSDDIVITIFFKVEGDPSDWARLACACSRFSDLVRSVCYRAKVTRSIPSLVVSNLLFRPALRWTSPADGDAAAAAAPGGWALLHKLSVCCPGLFHAGLLLDNSDFGLERDIGPDQSHLRLLRSSAPPPVVVSPTAPFFSSSSSSVSTTHPSSSAPSVDAAAPAAPAPAPAPPAPDDIATWSLFDDLYFDTVHDAYEAQLAGGALEPAAEPPAAAAAGKRRRRSRRRRQWEGAPAGAHLAAGGNWSLSREQGHKLLASRFWGDSLYICDWPGCVHTEGSRNYMLFRGVFKDFDRSAVRRCIRDGRRSTTGLHCAFCACPDTWDLHTAFCLRRVFGFHDDGEPEVRAYVCDNGHVSGAWTDRPVLYG